MARDQSHSAENKVWAPFAKALQNASLRYSLRVLLTALAMTAVNGKHPKKLERLRAFLRFTEKQRPPLRGGCVSLKLFQSLWSGLVQIESAAQPGSAAKAAFSLERPCPMKSMAPVLAIV